MGGVVAAVMALAGEALVALNLLAEGVLAAGEDQTHRSEGAAEAMFGVRRLLHALRDGARRGGTGILFKVLGSRGIVEVGGEDAMQ